MLSLKYTDEHNNTIILTIILELVVSSIIIISDTKNEKELTMTMTVKETKRLLTSLKSKYFMQIDIPGISIRKSTDSCYDFGGISILKTGSHDTDLKSFCEEALEIIDTL